MTRGGRRCLTLWACLGALMVVGAVWSSSAQEGGLAPPSREVLSNGMRLIIQEHRAADIVALYLFVGVGVRDEAPDQLGFSHFQEHMLFKGTDTWGPGFIDRAVEGVGGWSNATTQPDFTSFSFLLPAEETANTIRILADMAFRSNFDPTELDRERTVIFEEARIETDNPRTALVRGIYGLVFRGHQYGYPLLGTRKTLSAGTRERVFAYYKRHYTPENMALIVVGPVAPDEVRAAVQRTFGKVSATGYRRAPMPTPPPVKGVVREQVERPEQQAYLALGWSAPATDSADSFPVDLLVSILGGTESSRLARTLRDRERLVSRITMGYGALEHGAIVSVRAELEAEDLEKVERRILEEIAKVQEQGVTEAERELAVTTFEAEHAFDSETVEGIAENYGFAEMTWSLKEQLRYVKSLKQVTREQIREAARRYLARTDYARLAFVPRKKK